ncbi:MAG: DUF1778 domain-containing protein [Pseudomonadota bacterium]
MKSKSITIHSGEGVSIVRSARLGLRTTPAQAAIIQRAAEVKGKSVTEFVLSSACEKAEQTLLDQRFFSVSEKSWREFQKALERPAQMNPGLRRLITKPAVWEETE